jgi:hypothetical protein
MKKKQKMFDLLSIKHADFFVKHLGNFNHIYIEKEEIEKNYILSILKKV